MADYLLSNLSQLTRRLGRDVSEVSLRAGLALADGDSITPALAQEAAERAGFSAKVEKRALTDTANFILPVMLLLEDKKSCLLISLNRESAEVIFSDKGEAVNGVVQKIPLSQLQAGYGGSMLILSPVASNTSDTIASENRSTESAISRPRFWFWGTVVKSWGLYSEVVVASLLINIFTLAIPLFVMNVYDRVIPNSAMDTLSVLATGVAIVLGFDFILRILRGWFLDVAGKRADLLLSQYLMEQLIGMRMEKQPRSAGAVASHLREFENLREFFTSSSLVALVDLPFIFLFVLVIQMLGGELAWVPLFTIPLILFVGFITQFPLHHYAKQSYRDSAKKQGVLVEALSGIEAIKSQGGEGLFLGRWKRWVGALAKSGQKSRFWGMLATNFSTLIHQLTIVVVVVMGVGMVTTGELSVGALVAVTILTGRAMAPLGNMNALLIRYRQSMVSMRGLNSMMKQPLERPSGKQFFKRPEWQGGVEFDEVSFGYGEEQAAVLEECSFKIESGERVGVIGHIGSGKSTLLRLILGLYQPQSGVVRADQTDIQQIDPIELRYRAGVVPQEITLFSGTVRENLTMGPLAVDDATLLRVAKLTGVDDFVQHHPHGYDMQIGERGRGLSGGQKQMVALTRALLLDPSILLLDEPTSAMDNGAEQQIMRRLLEIVPGKTVILVTHRSALLPLVDRLIVLERGKVVMDGARDAVLKRLSGIEK